MTRGDGGGALRVIGLMSGTSMDGVDAALVELEGDRPADLRWTVRAFRTFPHPDDRRARLREAAEGGTAEALCQLHAEVGEALAEAVQATCRVAGLAPSDVDVVGSHGQTVWHEPPAGGRRGSTLQLGDPATVAERTGIPVVSDFRSRDVAAGGHGAPLVPWADRVLFSVPGRRRALQNLGGMANVTWLPPKGSEEPVVAFDTGPGVALLDAAAELATGGRERFDRDGAMAARGTVDAALLERLLEDPFFDEPPPRSTGRERFGFPRVRELAREWGLEDGRPEAGWPDLLATLTELTARSVGDAYRRWVRPLGVDEVVLAGGGARNPSLERALRRALDPLPVLGGDALGLDPDAREAVAFALLAWAHVRGLPANVPSATGAAGPRVLGSWTPGRPR